ncbi:MAG: hypothetical protein C7B45_05900 [Sulfobacillus acidophilus]|uniref:Uncharacterized protein n=1 Tax=Sulfobacillus acidophilus TaxID=53633 RepID=A0A2T2WKF7_9FIRM|nr:MAG: hypothetical protein C7B45_05900 [Sulfobacillus acidophilus]
MRHDASPDLVPIADYTNTSAYAPEDSLIARVRRVQVRFVTKDEMPRWIDLMAQHHYLGRPDMVGQVSCDIVTVDDEWVALLGWASAALPVKARDRCRCGKFFVVIVLQHPPTPSSGPLRGRNPTPG